MIDSTPASAKTEVMGHPVKKDFQLLYQSFLQLESKDEVRRFMADLCTPKEIEVFAERFAIAKLLDETDLGYREIAAKTGASTTTVARVARFLKQEKYQGYKLVLDRLKS